MTENAVSVHNILGQIFLDFEILGPPEKKWHFELYFDPRPSVLLKKIYLFYLYP